MKPITSIEAHENIKPKKESHYKIILKVLKESNKDLTYREIFNKMNFFDRLIIKDATSINRRLSELRNIGKIERVEKRICSICKSNCYTHAIKLTILQNN